MTAEQMFNCLGYTKTSKNDSEYIIYEKLETYFSDSDDIDTVRKSTFNHCILFDLKCTTVNASTQNHGSYDGYDGDLAKSINAMEMMAVVKQCKEIGWLE